jgi:hypothetical protein
MKKLTDILELNNTMNKRDETEIYREFHSTTDFTICSAAHRTLSKINHIQGHKANLDKNSKSEIILVS